MRAGQHTWYNDLAPALLPTIAKGFNARFLYDPGMDGDIQGQDDYFAYGLQRNLAVAHTAVVDTIDYQDDAAFAANVDGFPADNFIGEWTGLVEISQGGSYTFSSTSDDGSHVWINGALVVSNGGFHGPETVSGTVMLDAGHHRVKVDFFEATVNPRILNSKPQAASPKPKP